MIEVTASLLTTHAYNPNRLPVPSWQYDLVDWMPRGSSLGFETIAAARAEDRKRARRLQRSCNPDAQVLGKWLEEAADKKFLPLSPSNSFYMRTCRRKLLGAVMAHVYGLGLCDLDVMAFTLIHPGWFYKSGDLNKADPKAIRKQLQRWLDRAGITAADGIFWAALHGEFDGTGYQLHYHGIASGKKADLIRNLYGQFGFISTDDIQQPVKCKDAHDLADWMSYCLKSYWLQKLKYIGQDGKLHKGKKTELQQPQYEEVLMWMARQHLLSLIIHSGFRESTMGIGGEGLGVK